MKDRLKEIEKAYKEKIFPKEVYQLERKLLPILEGMEQLGIKLDVKLLKKLSRKLNVQLKKLEDKIYKIAKIKFNISSSQQLSVILFKELKISSDGLRKTPGGVISTAAPELQKIKEKHKIVDLILEYRELMKLKTTYVDALPNLVDSEGRVHTTYHQLGTTTGRLSSSNPNLQNIPIRGEWGQHIRKAFVAKKGYKLLSADYSQIELRVAACLSQDEKMLRAFKDGKDIHKITAAEVNNTSLDKVTQEMRFQAKALNFGILYGMSVVGFAQAAGIPWDKAKEFVKEYAHDFVGIAKYIEETKIEARKKGYVETILGRRRYLPEITSSDFRIRQASERMAINMPVQGTAADIMKVAMIKIKSNLRKKENTARMLLQIHDELVLEVKDGKTEEVIEIIRDGMENVLAQPIFEDIRSIFKIHLKVDIKVGNNWGDMIKV